MLSILLLWILYLFVCFYSLHSVHYVCICVCVRVRTHAKWVIPCKISTAVNAFSQIYVKIAELLVTIDVSIHANFVHFSCKF